MPEAGRRMTGGERRWIVVGGLAFVVLVAGAAVGWWLLNETPPDLVDPPQPPIEVISDEAVVVDIDHCERVELTTVGTDRFGEELEPGDQGDAVTAQASGTVTNTSDEATGYDVVILFRGEADRRLDVGRTLVPEVAPGGSARWTVRSHRVLPSGDELRCAVASVSRPRLEGGATVPGT